jgi:hypothetical protein
MASARARVSALKEHNKERSTMENIPHDFTDHERRKYEATICLCKHGYVETWADMIPKDAVPYAIAIASSDANDAQVETFAKFVTRGFFPRDAYRMIFERS